MVSGGPVSVSPLGSEATTSVPETRSSGDTASAACTRRQPDSENTSMTTEMPSPTTLVTLRTASSCQYHDPPRNPLCRPPALGSVRALTAHRITDSYVDR